MLYGDLQALGLKPPSPSVLSLKGNDPGRKRGPIHVNAKV